MKLDHDAHLHLVQSCRRTRVWPDKPKHKGPHVLAILAGVAALAVVVGIALRVVL